MYHLTEVAEEEEWVEMVGLLLLANLLHMVSVVRVGPIRSVVLRIHWQVVAAASVIWRLH
jgi:hypothetical protein